MSSHNSVALIRREVVMAEFPVDGDQYRTIDRRMLEIKRQLNQSEGSPLDPSKVLTALQGIIEANWDATPSPSGRFIDCDAMPYIPDGWKIEEHHKGGQVEFDPSKVGFHLEPEQISGAIVGSELRERLKDKSVLNACALDHLLANTALIPESWKLDEQSRTRYIYFWGTVYRGGGGSLCVRYLRWGGGRWRWGYDRLGGRWDDQRPAAVLAS